VPSEKRPIRGHDITNLTQTGNIGNIPPEAFQAFECEAAGVIHGTVTLTLHVKDGHLIRYTIDRELSFVPGKPTTGSM